MCSSSLPFKDPDKRDLRAIVHHHMSICSGIYHNAVVFIMSSYIYIYKMSSAVHHRGRCLCATWHVSSVCFTCDWKMRWCFSSVMRFITTNDIRVQQVGSIKKKLKIGPRYIVGQFEGLTLNTCL